MKKIKGQFRQGDVLIEEAKGKKPALATAGQIILAHGEATGHAHCIAEKDQADWWKDGESLFIQTSQPSNVVHQEHAPINLKPNKTYRVTRQREYTPEAIRNVAD